MKTFQSACALLLAMSSKAYADDFAELEEFGGEARLFFSNFTASLVQVNATILAYGLIAIALVGAAAVALYYLFLESQNTAGTGSSYGSYGSNYNYYNARSSQDGYDFNGLNVVQWISMLQELYEKFDYNDLDCQKRFICEVMREPDYFGAVAQKFKTGFQYARYLEVLNLPDDIREILDEYLDANAHADGQKDCAEFFTCPYSVTDSVKRNMITGNSL